MISDELVRRMCDDFDFVPVCPEMEIGLGVPRDPIRIVQASGGLQLLQPASGRDLSGSMYEFAERFLSRIGAVHGFLLKSRSPSCAVRDASVFESASSSMPVSTDRQGLFARAVLARFDGTLVIDEMLLGDPDVRERWLHGMRAAGERPIRNC